ncbi:exonuclease domain-containing protein [Gordonia sihwensis]|uniref:exonuclease domain-containing protein n=1 Tax=Gordonia sihwensis TaxID=173559 RepID=UPI003D984A29
MPILEGCRALFEYTAQVQPWHSACADISRAAWSPDALVGFDLETTSPDPRTARIVSFSVVEVHRNGSRVPLVEGLVDPGVTIPDSASAVHGISTAHARQFGMNHELAVERIHAAISAAWARGLALAIYNAPYDLTVMKHCRLGGFSVRGAVVDPLVLSRMFCRRGSHTLAAVAESYGVELAAAHDSSSDAVAAAELGLLFTDLASGLSGWSTTGDIMKVQRALAVAQQIRRARLGDQLGWPQLGDVAA